jgi:hypothetical protein
MKACVRLFGTLPDYYPGEYPEKGLVVETWENISVAELVKLVHMSPEQVAIVAINGMLSKSHDTVPDEANVKFFQPLNGG